MAKEKGLYMWRAWSKDRARLCDAGWTRAVDSQEARRNAWLILCGPHAHLVVGMEIQEIPPGTN